MHHTQALANIYNKHTLFLLTAYFSKCVAVVLKSTQETEKTLKSQFEDNMNLQNEVEVYEAMSELAEIIKFTGCSEDVYESMVGIDPECAEDLCKIKFYFLILLHPFKPKSKLYSASCNLFIQTWFSDEVMTAVGENPEEALLRKFFQGT